ncbi:endonuclease/exonuclease/phosphatase family protein [Spongiimicrobium sp. 3-5]|uniref:endonuclease/exonuclease/phosphatase family protein n=1 Tax=Spongiimicrobium sp. 3-5 TaxID=3332596 RepID=UPI003981574B
MIGKIYYKLPGFIVLLALLCQACSSPPKNEEELNLRFMSFNIHYGYTEEGIFDLSKAAKQIVKLDPDIVALQEVDVLTNRSKLTDIPKELGKMTGLNPVFGKAIDYDGGAYGLAVLTKYPIINTKIHKLPNSGEAEQRIALEVILQPDENSSIRIVSTHLDYTNDALILLQSKTVNALFSDGTPTILAGDLNQTPDSPGVKVLKENWQPVFDASQNTFPADNPTKKIDYMLLHPYNSWKVDNARIAASNGASDHLPMVATVTLTTQKQ